MATDGPRRVRETEKAAAQFEALTLSEQLEVWVRIAGILLDPDPDLAYERELPFPWAATVYNDGAFEIWYRRLENGDVSLLSFRRV